jgi:beta-xylosidase
VIDLGGRYVLYYTALYGFTGRQCISVAVASRPRGPFVDRSKAPLVCQLNLGGSIDPSPFVGAGGTPYLVWKSQGTADDPPTIWSQQLGAVGTTVVGRHPTELLQPSQGWEAGVVEGPFVLPWQGRYLLFYSGNNWNTADYAIGVAVCDGPTGPCAKPLDRPVVASGGTILGPGGPSLFTDVHGSLWMAFHAWLPSKVGYPNSRLLFLERVTFASGLPVVQTS